MIAMEMGEYDDRHRFRPVASGFHSLFQLAETVFAAAFAKPRIEKDEIVVEFDQRRRETVHEAVFGQKIGPHQFAHGLLALIHAEGRIRPLARAKTIENGRHPRVSKLETAPAGCHHARALRVGFGFPVGGGILGSRGAGKAARRQSECRRGKKRGSARQPIRLLRSRPVPVRIGHLLLSHPAKSFSIGYRVCRSRRSLDGSPQELGKPLPRMHPLKRS